MAGSNGGRGSAEHWRQSCVGDAVANIGANVRSIGIVSVARNGGLQRGSNGIGGGIMPGVDELKKEIEAGVRALGQELPEGGAARLAKLIAELARWNARMNLTAVHDAHDMVVRHVLDSLAVRPYLEGPRVVDVGTGAGFPGLPLAIAEPALEITLIDRNARKIAFVRHAIGELCLRNATTLQTSAQDYAPSTRFDTVLCRALAAVPELTRIAGHLLADDGVLLALKGQYPAGELRSLADLPDAWDYTVTELAVPGLAPRSRHLVILKKKGP